MDAFEHVIATILQRQGFWTQTSLKVELNKQDKHTIKRPSSPRWELDVVAYRPADNLLWVVECKSYLDSGGVRLAPFNPTHRYAGRYKLFTEPATWAVVQARLLQQLRDSKAIHGSPEITLCLAAGRIPTREVHGLEAHFDAKGWKLFSPTWIREQLQAVAGSGYDNAIAAVTAKLLLRE